MGKESSDGLMQLALLILSTSDLNWNSAIGALGLPACRLTLQILGLVSLHNYMSQFLIINLFLSLCTLVLFLWKTLPNKMVLGTKKEKYIIVSTSQSCPICYIFTLP